MTQTNPIKTERPHIDELAHKLNVAYADRQYAVHELEHPNYMPYLSFIAPSIASAAMGAALYFTGNEYSYIFEVALPMCVGIAAIHNYHRSRSTHRRLMQCDKDITAIFDSLLDERNCENNLLPERDSASIPNDAEHVDTLYLRGTYNEFSNQGILNKYLHALASWGNVEQPVDFYSVSINPIQTPIQRLLGIKPRLSNPNQIVEVRIEYYVLPNQRDAGDKTPKEIMNEICRIGLQNLGLRNRG